MTGDDSYTGVLDGERRAAGRHRGRSGSVILTGFVH